MPQYGSILASAAAGIAAGIQNAAGYSAQAAARANGVSAAAQAAQGSFNQASANNANAIGDERIAQQYGFNSGQAAMANDYTSMMWDKSAAWNEDMFNRQMEFNAEQAQKQREWEEHMRATAYQTAVKDMEAAGLNPILAVTGGGIQTGSGSGGAASVGLPQMSGATGAMASGGLLQGNQASEGNYTGQMEYMGGMLGLLSAGLNGLSTALSVMGQNKDISVIIENMVPELFKGVTNDIKDRTNPKGNSEQYGHYRSDDFGNRNTYEKKYKGHWTDYWERSGLQW